MIRFRVFMKYSKYGEASIIVSANTIKELRDNVANMLFERGATYIRSEELCS